MWKSWFLANDLSWLGLPAMAVFMTAFVVIAVRALRASSSDTTAAAALPLADDMHTLPSSARSGQ
jgi:cbb3-type cytochrome oxidase subunit 3